jgi:hypothetical protein|tara:strand:+ start:305 stop:538 length:234 start_codon:yes stop_codon:yes gene_type:complete
MYKLNTRKIVREFEGKTKTARALTEHSKHNITFDAIDKWSRSGRIPINRFLELAMIAKEKNQRFDLYDYIIEEGKNE